jgi:hypothetical protein
MGVDGGGGSVTCDPLPPRMTRSISSSSNGASYLPASMAAVSIGGIKDTGQAKRAATVVGGREMGGRWSRVVSGAGGSRVQE